MALGMVEALDKLNEELELGLKVRIGVYSGPCVAGIVETKKKLCYDVWSPVVGMAVGFESSSVPGCVHTSRFIYEILKHEFEFEDRGMINVKGRKFIEKFC